MANNANNVAASPADLRAPTSPPPTTCPITRALARSLSTGHAPFMLDACHSSALFMPEATAVSTKPAATSAKPTTALARPIPAMARPTYLVVAASPPRNPTVTRLSRHHGEGVPSSLPWCSATNNMGARLPPPRQESNSPPRRSPRRQTLATSPVALSSISLCRTSSVAASANQSPAKATLRAQPAASSPNRSPTTTSLQTPTTVSPMQSSAKISPLRFASETSLPTPTVRMASMTTLAKTIEVQLVEMQVALKEQSEQLRIEDAQLAARDLQIMRILERLEMGATTNNTGSVYQEVSQNRATTSGSAEPLPEDPTSDDELPPVAPTAIRRGRVKIEPTALTLDPVTELINRAI
ncbi:hypothetical protein H6P81_015789 [Aristolochia fimbriata]|uniref:Uncharacterized protein n=1 Tax=Aristolochia fimbriata TaxID=158543 RepID=A0AAV7E774_ARIFI|nr:hypothetical protein H6P81_015789 [Aristolochia fimbriata]